MGPFGRVNCRERGFTKNCLDSGVFPDPIPVVGEGCVAGGSDLAVEGAEGGGAKEGPGDVLLAVEAADHAGAAGVAAAGAAKDGPAPGADELGLVHLVAKDVHGVVTDDGDVGDVLQVVGDAAVGVESAPAELGHQVSDGRLHVGDGDGLHAWVRQWQVHGHAHVGDVVGQLRPVVGVALVRGKVPGGLPLPVVHDGLGEVGDAGGDHQFGPAVHAVSGADDGVLRNHGAAAEQDGEAELKETE